MEEPRLTGTPPTSGAPPATPAPADRPTPDAPPDTRTGGAPAAGSTPALGTPAVGTPASGAQAGSTPTGIGSTAPVTLTPDAPRASKPDHEKKGEHGKHALDERLRALESQIDEEEARRAEKKARKEEKKQEKEAGKEEEKSKKDRVRGVETMFRSSYRVNMDLSSLADSKANMLVSVTGLLISIILGTLAPGLDTNPWLRLPTAVFLIFLTVAFVFGVLASRPRVESKKVTLDDVRRREANLLFFGHFANMPREEFAVGIKELMQDPDALYHSMAMDIYGVGSVLQKKYRLLRVSFSVLLVGMGLGVILFIGTFIAATPNLNPLTTTTTPAGATVQNLPAGSVPAGTPATGVDPTPLSPFADEAPPATTAPSTTPAPAPAPTTAP